MSLTVIGVASSAAALLQDLNSDEDRRAVIHRLSLLFCGGCGKLYSKGAILNSSVSENCVHEELPTGLMARQSLLVERDESARRDAVEIREIIGAIS